MYFFPKEFDFKGLAGDGYALITGGAEGIGKQCALYFAKKGINLILVDFNEKKLKETTKEINENVRFIHLNIVKFLVFRFCHRKSYGFNKPRRSRCLRCI